jgi:uncharacterized membrane protein YfcA
MHEIGAIAILFGTGTVAGFMNVTAGGGSSLTLPVLIFLGLDAALANGTNRIAIFLQSLSAVYAFKRHSYQQFGFSLKLALLTLPGAVAGALIAIDVSNALFQNILGIVMIGIIVSMVIPHATLSLDNRADKKITWPVALAMVAIGFYGGFIQVGVGFLLMAALNYLLRFDLVYVNMHKVFIVLVYTVPALLIFILTGNVKWTFGLSLAAGNALGGWWAANAAIKRGEKLIRVVLIVAMLVMSLKLLNVV